MALAQDKARKQKLKSILRPPRTYPATPLPTPSRSCPNCASRGRAAPPMARASGPIVPSKHADLRQALSGRGRRDLPPAAPPAVFASAAKHSRGLARGSGLLRFARKDDLATEQVNANCRLRRRDRHAAGYFASSNRLRGSCRASVRAAAMRSASSSGNSASGTGGACFSAWRAPHIRAARRHSPASMPLLETATASRCACNL